MLQAALAAGRHIPHLCYHPEFRPHGSCKLCTVKVNGSHATSCTLPARAGLEVESETAELNAERRMMVQLLFVEGNHFCPSCEKSGHCKLQAVAYDLGMTSPRFDHFFPDRPVDASAPGAAARLQPLHPLRAVRARLGARSTASTCSRWPAAAWASTSSSTRSPACCATATSP
ncbi:MAG: 2Fe-2S iron-sulfur cluster-binding protein [Desulfobacterales bacterium]|nr:2Fe-2S iron-sulfur cluster-binding protein [Desulfobacterales bacterium]